MCAGWLGWAPRRKRQYRYRYCHCPKSRPEIASQRVGRMSTLGSILGPGARRIAHSVNREQVFHSHVRDRCGMRRQLAAWLADALNSCIVLCLRVKSVLKVQEPGLGARKSDLTRDRSVAWTPRFYSNDCALIRLFDLSEYVPPRPNAQPPHVKALD